MSTHMDNILDVEPRAMSFHFVRDTTNDFSEEQVIGQGGYGIVYKIRPLVLINRGLIGMDRSLL